MVDEDGAEEKAPHDQLDAAGVELWVGRIQPVADCVQQANQ